MTAGLFVAAVMIILIPMLQDPVMPISALNVFLVGGGFGLVFTIALLSLFEWTT